MALAIRADRLTTLKSSEPTTVDLEQVDSMRALIAFLMLVVLTLPALGVEFSRPQAEPEQLHDDGSTNAALVAKQTRAGNDLVNLHTKPDTFANAAVSAQHRPAGPTRHRQVIGWREHIILPDFGSVELDAKIDTGARTSALHAVDLTVERRNGEEWVSFHVPYLGEPRSVRHRARIFDRRKIRNTSGIAQLRYVIRTALVLGNRQWQIEVSLTDREQMKFDMILGRTAIRHKGLLVAPGKSYLTGTPVSPFVGKSGKSLPRP